MKPAGKLDPLPALEICILAGGLSTRMGGDKTRLPLGDRNMLAQIKVTARVTGLPVRVIRRDLVPRCGPIGGLYTALKTTAKDAVLFLACDMPFVGVEIIDRLVQRFDGAHRSLFVSSGTRVSFPFILSRDALAVLAEQLGAQEYSIQALARKIGAEIVQVSGLHTKQLRNVNTPADWKKARLLWAKRQTLPKQKSV